MTFMVRKNCTPYYNVSDNMELQREIFEQLNSRATNNKQQDIPNHVFYLDNPAFIVPRHTLIDIINREIVPFKAKSLNKRLVLFYAHITT